MATSATTRRAKRLDPWKAREESSLFLALMLRFAGWARRPLTLLGVDFPIFRELLRTRILIDLRGQAASAMGAAGIVLLVMGNGMIGLLTGIAAIRAELSTWLLISQSALLLLLFFYLTQALIGMLVDPTDVRALAPHPVPGGTLYAVRLAQVFGYLALLAASFTAGNLALAVFGQPPVVTLIAFPLLSLASTLTALGSVALVFSVLLRLVGPTHFQRVALWAQIVGAMVVMGGQGWTRLVSDELATRVSEHPVTPFAWPPMQFARVGELALGHWNREVWIGLAYTVGVPALALFATLRLAARSYVAALAGGLELGGPRPASWPQGPFTRLARWIRLGREQRAAFEFVAALSRREAHVLRAVLPQAVGLQAAAIGIGVGMHDTGVGWSFYFSYSSGMLALLLPNLLEMCQGSSTAEARWLFVASPIESEADLVRGGAKGLFAAWYCPCLAGIALVQWIIAGPAQIPGILLGVELSLIVALTYTRMWSMGVPFTRPPKKQALDNIGLMMTMMLALGALGVLHWVLSYFAVVQAAAVLAFAVPVWLLWRSLDRIPVGKGRSLAADGKSA